jgi:asparagine synthase (glutamine-hydrolysing)
MSTPDGSCWISYNGEFYNHRLFRSRLEARGCIFRSTSDTETLLFALQAWGPGVLEEVAGIFALAFWDSRHRRLLLARDPLGVKPLYYHDDGRRVVFASEIKALLLAPAVAREPDPEAVNQYLHFHAPFQERTFFRDIKQVLPAEYVEVDGRGLRRKTYWQLTGFANRNANPRSRSRS